MYTNPLEYKGSGADKKKKKNIKPVAKKPSSKELEKTWGKSTVDLDILGTSELMESPMQKPSKSSKKPVIAEEAPKAYSFVDDAFDYTSSALAKLKDIFISGEESDEIEQQVEKGKVTVPRVDYTGEEAPVTYDAMGMVDYGYVLEEKNVYDDYIGPAKTNIAKKNKISIREVSNEDAIAEAKRLAKRERKTELLKSKAEQVANEYEDKMFNFSDVIESVASRALSFGGIAVPTEKEILYAAGRNVIADELTRKPKEDVKKGVSKIKLYNVGLAGAEDEIRSIDSKIKSNSQYATPEIKDKRNRLLDSYNALKNARSKELERLNESIDKAEDLGTLADVAKRSYRETDVWPSRIASTLVKAVGGVAKLGKEITVGGLTKRITGDGVEAILPDFLKPVGKFIDESTEGVENFSRNANELAEDINSSVRRDVGAIEGLTGGPGKFGSFAVDLFSNQVVSTAATILAPEIGLALISSGAAGNKMSEMDIEVESTPGLKISPLKYYASGLLYGAAEYLTEKVELDQLSTLKKAYSKSFDLKDDLTNEIFTATDALKKYGVNVNKEGSAELLSQLMQNATDKFLLDKNISLTNGLSEAYLSGAFMSGLGFQSPVLAADVYRAFSTDENSKKAKSNSSEIARINKKINETLASELNEDGKKAITLLNEKKQSLLNDNLRLKGETEAVIDQLSNKDKKGLLNIDSEKYELRKRIDDINNNIEIDSADKKSLITDLSSRMDVLNGRQQRIIGNSVISKELQKTKNFEMAWNAANNTNTKTTVIVENSFKKAIEIAKAKVEQADVDPDAKKQMLDLVNRVEKEGKGFDVAGNVFGAELGMPIAIHVRDIASTKDRRVVQHETSHRTIFKKILEGNGDIVAISKMLEDYMISRYSNTKAIFDNVAKTYSSEGEKSVAEEKLVKALTLLSDRDIEQDVKLMPKLFDTFKSLIGKEMSNTEFKGLETGKDVLDLLKSFSASFEQGELTGLVKQFAEMSIDNKTKTDSNLKFSKTIDERREELEDKLAQDEIDYDRFDELMAKLDKEEEEAKNPKPKVEVKKEEKPVVDKEEVEDEKIIKDNKGAVASDKVQAIYEAKGVDGAFDIIKLFKPIVSKLVDKRRDAPGFDKPLLTDEIETGKNGLFDLIKSYDPNSGVPLAAYVNKYLPVRAIEASKRILAKEFSKEIDEGSTSYNDSMDDDYSFDSTLDEMREEEERQSGLINPLDMMGDKLSTEYSDAVNTALEAMSEKEIGSLTFAKLNDLAPEVTGKFFGIPTAKVTNAAANLATPEIGPIQKIIYDNRVKLIKLLPEGAILEGTPASESLIGTGLSIPRKIQAEFYDQKERLSKGAGLIPFELKKNITHRDFLAAFGIKEDGVSLAFGGKDPRAQTMLAMIRLYGKIASNTAVRMAAVQTLEQQADLKAGASKIQFSKSIKDDAAEYVEAKANSIQFSKAMATVMDIPFEDLYFSNINNIKKGREGLVELAKELGPVNAVKFLSSTNRSGWGTFFGGITAKDLKENNPFQTNSFQEYDGIKKWRLNYFLSLNSNDFYNNILKDAFGDVEYKINSRFVTINGEKIELPTAPPQNAKGIVDGSFFKNKTWGIEKRIEFAKSERDNLKELIFTLKAMHASGKLTKQQIGLILKTFNSSTKSILRTAAIPGLYMKSPVYKKDSDYIYEHVQPASATLIELSKLMFDKKYKKDFDQIMSGYKVAIIPKAYDNIISGIYKSSGPIDAKGNLLLSSKNNIFRYYSQEVSNALANANLPKLKLVDASPKPEFPVKISFSKSLSDDFNAILETTQGISKETEFSDITARIMGANKGKYRFFVPPSAEDFLGLLYDFMGKGKEGEKHMEFFKQALIHPYVKGVQRIDNIRANIKEGYKALKAEYPVESKKLKSKVEGKEFTYDQAVRVYLWQTNDVTVPGLSSKEITAMSNTVKKDKRLREFADKLSVASGQLNGWVEPTEYWNVESIVSDLHNATEKVGRRNILSEFIENSEVIFSPENLNKVEAALGSEYRSALEDAMFRMKNGSNKSSGDRFSAAWTNWIANANGTIMFFNTRSALLQTIAATNYLNWSDNNPVAAGRAFLNQPQYWKDFAMIFNSNKLKERREGLKSDVNEAELANAVKDSKNKAKAALSYLLKIGYTPTQIADSFAIAAGGSTFYRNRVRTYEKQGMSTKEAEDKAFEDFDNATEESQQSSDPSKLSQQQASTAGRLILAFANTPMQYNRLMKKAFRDLKNNRGDAKTNVSKILYYGAVQNLIFSALQNALFSIVFEDDEEVEDEKNQAKYARILNGMADTILRGTGIAGAVVSTAKNALTTFLEEREKGFKGDQGKTIVAALGISPPIGSKASKLYSAIKTDKIDKDVIAKRGFDVLDDGRLNLSPSYDIAGKLVAVGTNFPLDRVVDKVNNVSEMLDNRNAAWQRVALGLGWKPFDIGAANEEEDRIRVEAKTARKDESSIESAKKRIIKKAALQDRIRSMSSEEREQYRDSLRSVAVEKSNRRKMIWDETEAVRDSIKNSKK